MNDADRYDLLIAIVAGLIMGAIIRLGGPLWTLLPIMVATVTISLYRHLPLPPRRR